MSGLSDGDLRLRHASRTTDAYAQRVLPRRTLSVRLCPADPPGQRRGDDRALFRDVPGASPDRLLSCRETCDLLVWVTVKPLRSSGSARGRCPETLLNPAVHAASPERGGAPDDDDLRVGDAWTPGGCASRAVDLASNW